MVGIQRLTCAGVHQALLFRLGAKAASHAEIHGRDLNGAFDNVHQALCPPPVFERWVLPEYVRRNERLHAAGKKTYPHWDGDCGQLLPYARDCGFEGFEAITPLPQGDVTLEQVREALGEDQILVDGIPCTDFLPSEPIESLIINTKKCIEYFHPHLVLGISDELSPVGDIARVRMVSQICAECAE